MSAFRFSFVVAGVAAVGFAAFWGCTPSNVHIDTGVDFSPPKVEKVDEATLSDAGPNGLSLEQIKTTMHPHLAEIRKCHPPDPGDLGGGSWSFRLKIDPKGTVQAVKLTSSTDSEKSADDCVLKLVSGITFDKSDKPTSVSEYVVYFGAVEDASFL